MRLVINMYILREFQDMVLVYLLVFVQECGVIHVL